MTEDQTPGRQDARKPERQESSLGPSSIQLSDVFEWSLRLAIAVAALALRQLDLLARQLLVGNVPEKMRDQVEPGASLVVAANDIPGGEPGIRRCEHVVTRAGIIEPAAVGLEVHRRKLPDLSSVIDPRLDPAGLLVGAHLEPVLDQDDPVIHDGLLDQRNDLQEALDPRHVATPHDPLATGSAVPH